MSSKVIVITGVSKGIGRAMTTYYLSHGHTVIGCARSQDIISDMKVQFASASDRCHLSVVDVTKDAQVEAWAKETLKIASPHIVINNAAAAFALKPIWDISSEEFNNIIDTNLNSRANVMRHFLPDMIKAGRGVLVDISSVIATQPFGQAAAHSAAKHGAKGLSNAVSQELPEPLCSVLLDPGIMGTPGSVEAFPSEIFTRLMSAEDWAEKACPFILTIDRSMNGQTIKVYEQLGMKCGVKIKDGMKVMIEGIDY